MTARHLELFTRRGQVTVELVGPKGYVHGWIHVGVSVKHPDGSKGTVTAYHPGGRTVAVDWHTGPQTGKSGTYPAPAAPTVKSPVKPVAKPPSASVAKTPKRMAVKEPATTTSSTARTYPDLHEGRNHLEYRKAPSVAAMNLSGMQQLAVKEYVGDGYKEVNGHLRGQKKSGAGTLQTIKNLKGVFASAPKTTEPMTVVRGVTNADAMFGPKGSKLGKVFTDKGFVSTSTNTDATKAFGKGTGKATVSIHVPPGSSALTLGRFGVPTEDEVLLNAGSTFRVVADTTVKGKRQIELELTS